MATTGKAITPTKSKETKKPSIEAISPKKTQQTKNASSSKKTPEKKKPRTKKTENNHSNNKNKISNGNVSDSDVVELEMVPSSSSESLRGAELNGGKFTKKSTPKSKKSNQRRKQKEEEVEEIEEVKPYAFPMERVKRIIRSENSDLRITHDAVLLVNKATEKFLEKFSEDALACSVKDRKKSLAYKHLSSAVSNRKRYNFLSDYVPKKLKAEDALAKSNLAKAKEG